MQKTKLILVSVAALLLSKNSYAKDVQYKITENAGMIACVTESIFNKVINYSLNKNINEIQALITTGQCIYLPKDTILFGAANICGKGSKDTDLAKLKPDGLTKKMVMPCAAIKDRRQFH